ncbi:MAG: MltA domain-containing protein, partial [Azonexus sp.]
MRKIQAAALFAAIFLAACGTTPPTSDPTPGCKPCAECPPCPPPVATKAPVPSPAQPPAPAAPPEGAPLARTLKAAKWADLPGWADDDLAAAWPAFIASCRGMAGKPHGPSWKRVCDLARAADGKPGHDPRRFFETHLKPYAILGDGNPSGLVTGYYEPLLRGSRTRANGFEQPVRGVPDDLLTVDL